MILGIAQRDVLVDKMYESNCHYHYNDNDHFLSCLPLLSWKRIEFCKGSFICHFLVNYSQRMHWVSCVSLAKVWRCKRSLVEVQCCNVVKRSYEKCVLWFKGSSLDVGVAWRSAKEPRGLWSAQCGAAKLRRVRRFTFEGMWIPTTT